MPDKLTDAEVKKALEWCAENLSCTDCPLRKTKSSCSSHFLDLINRQEQEIEFLKTELSNCEFLKKEFEIDKKNALAEVEDYKHLDVILNTAVDKLAKDIKAEAYKEFAEKLEEKFKITEALLCEVNEREVVFTFGIIELKKYVDNLLNELVGGSDG